MEQARLESEEAMVRPMGDVLGALTGREPEDFSNPGMLVITNEQALDGAVFAGRPDVLEEAREMLGCKEIMILPSSKHEILAIPSDLTSARDAEEMVTEINRSQVADQDVLSDHVYKYDGEALQRVETETRTRAKTR